MFLLINLSVKFAKISIALTVQVEYFVVIKL